MRNRGFSTCRVDIEDDAGNDLGSAQGAWEAEQLAADASFLAIEIDCSSWSTARRAPVWSSMPHRLRKKGRYLMGLPGLPPRDRAKLKGANAQLRSVAKMIDISISCETNSGFLENPKSSLIWHYPLRRYRKRIVEGKLFIKECTMCGYGTRLMKPTRLLVWASCKQYQYASLQGTTLLRVFETGT